MHKSLWIFFLSLFFSLQLAGQSIDLEKLFSPVDSAYIMTTDSIIYDIIDKSIVRLDSIGLEDDERLIPMYFFTHYSQSIIGATYELDTVQYRMPYTGGALNGSSLFTGSSGWERSNTYYESDSKVVFEYEQLKQELDIKDSLLAFNCHHPYIPVIGRNSPYGNIMLPYLTSQYLILRLASSYPDGNMTSFYRESIIIFERRND